MIQSIYSLLESIGYRHPLHPPMTHLPAGLVIASFLFALGALVFKRAALAQTARHCMILALVSIPPVVLLGYMDWQHKFSGAWILPIRVKIVMAAVLTALLIVSVAAGRRRDRQEGRLLLLSILSVIAVTALGYFGGELVHGKGFRGWDARKGLPAQGAVLFGQNCSVCHFPDKDEKKVGPGLKGIFQRERLPVSGRPATEENIRNQLRKPFKKMPSFSTLSESDVSALMAFLKTL